MPTADPAADPTAAASSVPVGGPDVGDRSPAAGPSGNGTAVRPPAEPAVVAARGRRLVRRSIWGLRLSLVLANVIGAAAVFVLGVWVLPNAHVADPTRLRIFNAVLTVGYVTVTVPLGMAVSVRRVRRALRWLSDGRIPDQREVRSTQRAPVKLFTVQAVLWVFAAALFSLINAFESAWLIPRAGLTILLGGVTVCSITYLFAERILRSVVAVAVANSGDVSPARTPGVTMRAMLTWALGPGVLTFGLAMIGLFSLVEPEPGTSIDELQSEITQIGVTMVVFGTAGLVIGALTTLLGARAIAAPVGSVRVGLRRVQRGDLDTQIPVYDGSELGQLQAGFNQMVAGLRERERLRDLFGRHVGEDVARAALAQGPALGGETRDAAVLFVDLVGSTTIATQRTPDEVLALLNRFFGVVVDVVDEHGGWINKFQGDAALAIFGAPGSMQDPAGAALAAGRELCDRLPSAVPECEAGIGVSFGSVVAGYLGDETRYEYTVIGDPVNVAARLTELAKSETVHLLTTGDTVAAARSDAERSHWVVGDAVALRGRPAPLRLARPTR